MDHLINLLKIMMSSKLAQVGTEEGKKSIKSIIKHGKGATQGGRQKSIENLYHIMLSLKLYRKEDERHIISQQAKGE